MASRSWNRVELIGNLTRDPELRYTPNGAAVCTFGLATNRTYVSEGERKEEVDFHRLVSWNKLAELCNQLLKKGMKIFISGRLQTRSWEGQDGGTRQTTEIVIEDMIILTPKSGNGEVAVETPSETVDLDELKVSEPEKPDKLENQSIGESASQSISEPESQEDKPEKKQAKAAKEDVDPDSDLPF